MTGRGRGFCILQREPAKPAYVKGLAGADAAPVTLIENRAEQATDRKNWKQNQYANIRNPAATAHRPRKNRPEKEVTDMPGGDGTGPMGMGPMTGRAAGYCAEYPVPGYMNSAGGRGFGMGWGRGLGYGRGLGLGFRGGRGRRGAWGPAYGAYGAYGAVAPYGAAAPYPAPMPAYTAPYAAGPTPEQEADMLKGQAEYIEDMLDGIKKRLAALESATETKD